MKWRQLAISCAAAALILVACGTGERHDGNPTPTDVAQGHVGGPVDNLSLSDVYQRMTEAITREGSVFHTRVRLTRAELTPPVPTPTHGGGPLPTIADVKQEIWLDARDRVARIDTGNVTGTKVQQVVVGSGGTFETTDGKTTGTGSGRWLRCRGTDSPLLSRLMLCVNGIEKSQTTVMSGTYGSEDVIVLVTEGTAPDEDRDSPFTARFYMDRGTFLPIAAELRLDYGSEVANTSSVYENEFVTRSSLAADFFEPAAIGYVAPDPEAALNTKNPGIPVYWLGREFTGTGGRPNLSLTTSEVHVGFLVLTSTPFRASLEYADSGDPQRLGIIGMEEFSIADWNAVNAQSPGGNWWDGKPLEEVDLPDGRVVLFEDGSQYGDYYRAQVFKPDTVILLTDLTVPRARYPLTSPSPYNNRDGFLAVIRALSLRQ